jgi:UDP-N-acetylmuramyl tripeptide synthase
VIGLGNLFRDQLDRYGELELVAERWRAALSGDPAALAVVNVDDPLLAEIARTRPSDRVLAFGLDDSRHARPSLQHAADSKYCFACGAPFVYSAAYVGHLGDYRCPSSDRARPALDVSAREIELDGVDGSAFELATPAGSLAVRIGLPGLYNVYNATAAAAIACALEIPLAEIGAGLERSVAAFGRFERIAVGGRRLLMLLIKNPAGANEAVRTLLQGDPPRLAVVALNDAIADGRDVSWIWDVDFEPLLGGLDRLIAAGDRAAELALRFAYGGLARERIDVVPDLEQALDRGLDLTPPGAELVILPTYTAMLGLRRIVARRGHVAHYWERAA